MRNNYIINILNCMIINYLQILSLVVKLDVQWPVFIESSSETVDFLGDIDRIVGFLECPFSEIALNLKISLHSVKVFTGTVLLVFLLSLIFFFWGLYYCFTKVNVKNKIIISLISISVLSRQPVIELYTSNFRCIHIDGKSFLRSFTLLECNVITKFIFFYLSTLLYLYIGFRQTT